VVLFERNEQMHEGHLEVEEVIGQRLDNKKKKNQFDSDEPFYLTGVVVKPIESLVNSQFLSEG
jgi:hypothetical protein